MGLENNKWRVQRGDCLWKIAASVYHNGNRWREIASANGLPTSGNPIIYPGQLFILRGITPGSQSNSPAPAPVVTTNQVSIDWFGLEADTEREMYCVWTWSKSPQSFKLRWWGMDRNTNRWIAVEEEQTQLIGNTHSITHTFDNNITRCVVEILPIKDSVDGHPAQDNCTWKKSSEYNFANNPPKLPPTPEIEIDEHNKLTVTVENIDQDINADSLEIAVYKNNTLKFQTAKVTIDTETHFAQYTSTVEPGGYYKIRCRAVRGNVYGGWTEFTANEQAVPTAPKEITVLRAETFTDQSTTSYNVRITWTPEETATHYEIQWTTNPDYFDTTTVDSYTTTPEQGSTALLTGIATGHEYFFRVRSINDKGSSTNWTPIKSIRLGQKPSAPTTWSNTISNIIGEDLNLYWTHNSTDGSIERLAKLHFTIIDSAHPGDTPMEKEITVNNNRTGEEATQTSSYTINASDPEWSMLSSGFILKWKVQTAGVSSELSDWSIERQVNVYQRPTLTLAIKSDQGLEIDEVNSFPFYLSFLSTPLTQTPISYYIEVIANDSYETVDAVGNVKTVNVGDKIYQRYYDPDPSSAWNFMLEMTPANIDLETGINYTINATLSMNSGLIATDTKSFDANLSDVYYQVYGDVVINKETLEASIHPYCKEFEYTSGGETEQVLTANCKLAVYRREYDGSFTEIATDISNEENLFVTDPHPSLDYARYRIVARDEITGSISYNDIDPVEVKEPSVVIQWSEEWTSFKVDNSGDENVEPAWSGSMVKIPYNVDISDNKNVDKTLVSYIGRRNPVSYYGTQIGETGTWNVEIPAYDKETLYSIRRLSKFTGDVYVREPSGIGYWANVVVSYTKTHNKVTIPISFNVTRVEGGM